MRLLAYALMDKPTIPLPVIIVSCRHSATTLPLPQLDYVCEELLDALQDACRDNGGVLYGSFDWLQWRLDMPFEEDDLMALCEEGSIKLMGNSNWFFLEVVV